MSSPRPASLAAGLGAAVTAISSAALVILLAEPLPPPVIAAGRVTVTGLALLLLGAKELGSLRLALRDRGVSLRIVIAAGLLAVHFAAWVASLSLTTVPRAVTLVATQPLFAGLVGRWVGDRAPMSLYVGAAVALAGTLVMVAGEDPSGMVGFNGGDGLALLAAAAAAAYLAVGRSVRKQLPLRPYLGTVHLVAAVLLGLMVVLGSYEPWPTGADGTDLLALLYLGLVPGLIGHGLINWAVRFVPVHVVALATLVEPVGATVLTVLLFGYTVTSAELWGAGVLLVGVALGLPRRPS
ncbi:MAG: DMT family transporter [Myxococcota bacterium]